MKKIIYILIFINFIFCSLDRYTKAMLSGINSVNQIDASHSDLLEASNLFFRVCQADKTNWLPCYYYAFCNVKLSFIEEDPEIKDEYLDNSLYFLDSFDSLLVYDDIELEILAKSEIYTLYAMIMISKIFVDPMSRGREYGAISENYINKAIELNPDNPRPYFIMGQSKFYTPAAFGGGIDKALPLIKESMNKYDVYSHRDLWPNWGKNEAITLYNQSINNNEE